MSSTAGRFGSLLDDARTPDRVLISPIATFRRRRGRLPFLGPWLAISVATAVLTFGAISVTQRTAAHVLRDTVTSEVAEQVSEDLRRMRWLSGATASAGIALRWAIAGSAFWAIAALLGKDLPWRLAVGVAAAAAGPEVLGRGVDFLTTWTLGPEFGSGLTPRLASSTSLAALFVGDGPPSWTTAVLEQITPFALWTGVLWWTGLRVAGRLDARFATAVALPPWVAAGLVGAAVAVLRDSMAGATGIPGVGG